MEEKPLKLAPASSEPSQSERERERGLNSFSIGTGNPFREDAKLQKIALIFSSLVVTRKKPRALGTENSGLNRTRRFYYAGEKQDSVSVEEKSATPVRFGHIGVYKSALLILQKFLEWW